MKTDIEQRDASNVDAPNDAAEQADPLAPDGIVIGTIADLRDGIPFVDFAGNPNATPLSAMTTVKVMPNDKGRNAALSFINGQFNEPIVMGLIVSLVDDAIGETAKSIGNLQTIEAEADNERVVLSADKEITLKCGKASITLTRAGKVIVRGSYVSTHSTGVNRIKGGSVQLN